MQPTCIPKRKRSRDSRLPYRFVRKPGAASQEQPGAARSSQLVLSAWGCGALHHLPQVVRHAMQRWESTARFRSSPRCDVYEFIVDPDKPDPPEADTCVCPLGHGHFRFLPRPCIPTEFIHARPETAKENTKKVRCHCTKIETQVQELKRIAREVKLEQRKCDDHVGDDGAARSAATVSSKIVAS